MTRLSTVSLHHTVEVVEIRSDCDRAGRLAALGVLPGSRITVSHVAPLGDPISVRLGDQEISVRRTEASLVLVREVA